MLFIYHRYLFILNKLGYLMFRVFTTEEFDKDFDGLDGSEKMRVRKFRDQLRERGDEVGKPLAGLSIFREKKFNGNRLYFLVYKQFSVVLLLAISDKKAQQATINKILLHLAEYEKDVIARLKKHGII